MKIIKRTLALALALITSTSAVDACTNFIVTRGASTDGSVMVTYAADSHALYGALYQTAAGQYKRGATLPIYEWDTHRYLGDIAQVRKTYSTVGNMNEHSLIIGETTYGGRAELADSTGRMDYGSLIYVTLQRAKTARQAIETIAELANEYGYYSSGESFSIADTHEAWIMELIGKGIKLDEKGNNTRKGIVWVARRIPDGYVSGHANQSRISTFPLDDKENCLYSDDVIDFAREMGYFEGEDKDFSFCDAYAPLDFWGARACEARVWSFFRTVADDMDQYTDYAMGHNHENRMPLWVKPRTKVSPKVLFDAMRDHYEGTPMDMTTDIGAGGNALPYRWRPMSFEVDGVEYCNERATATQQTGFWFTAQARADKGDDMGILWFGVDDAATSCLTPIYSASTAIAAPYSQESGSMLRFSMDSAFWRFSMTTAFAYMNYSAIAPDIKTVANDWENSSLAEVETIDEQAMAMPADKAREFLTKYSVDKANALFKRWGDLYGYLMIKHVDGNLKSEKGTVLDYLAGDMTPAHFVDNGNNAEIPDDIKTPGYNQKWCRAVVEDNGEILKVVE